jgi:hypothetical protein
MWWGYPHLPNSALIKTAIKDGFAYDNRLHDCLRFYWLDLMLQMEWRMEFNQLM